MAVGVRFARSNGAQAAAWPQTDVNVAPDNTSGPQLPMPSVQNFGISFQGQLLLGAELGMGGLHNHDP